MYMYIYKILFRKIWLPSFTKNAVVLQKACKNCQVFGLKIGQKIIQERGEHRIEARFGLRMPGTPLTNFSLTILMDSNLWVQSLSYLPVLQEGKVTHTQSAGNNCRVPGNQHSLSLPLIYINKFNSGNNFHWTRMFCKSCQEKERER